jgi:large subunit ribosomal protein L3
MATGIMGKKIGMSQIFNAEGKRIPVTLIDTSSCTVLKKKTAEGKDGYNAVVFGFGVTKEKALNKPELGFFKKAKSELRRRIRELRVSSDEISLYETGKDVSPSLFTEGEKVDVTGISKGRGYQGVVKRHGVKGHPKTRGTHEFRRHIGSVGTNTWPGRVIPGKKMPGHMGNANVTVQNLTVMKIVPEKNLIVVQGSVPGSLNSMVIVRKAVKNN